jgi:vacuolar protein sorting-associated protein 35
MISVYKSEGGNVEDCIHVITKNLNEMNKLWIRMSGKSKDKPRREKERIDLKITVGENIHRLSSLEGVNSEIYKTVVLPKLLEMILSSEDAIS